MALARRRLSLLAAEAGDGHDRQAVDASSCSSWSARRVFSLTFYGVNGHVWVEHLLTSLPGGQLGFLIVVNILIFFLAFFLDFFELSFIVIPLVGPVADKLGIDLIWFGVLLGVNMQTSFMHPPFGFALFYLRSVAPAKEYIDQRHRQARSRRVTTGQIYWGAVPFVLIQIVMVALIIAFPKIVVARQVEEKIDLDKVKIEMPAAPGGDPFAPPLNDPFATPPAGTDPFATPSGAAQPGADAASAPASSEDEEQRKQDELFGTPKK